MWGRRKERVSARSVTTKASGGSPKSHEPHAPIIEGRVTSPDAGDAPTARDAAARDWSRPHTPRARRVSLGILGMEDRVALLGGRFEITSALGKGTEVAAFIPITGGVAEHRRVEG